MTTTTRPAKLNTAQIETLFRAALPGATVSAVSATKGDRAVTLVTATYRGKSIEVEVRTGHRLDVASLAHEAKETMGL